MVGTIYGTGSIPGVYHKEHKVVQFDSYRG